MTWTVSLHYFRPHPLPPNRGSRKLFLNQSVGWQHHEQPAEVLGRAELGAAVGSQWAKNTVLCDISLLCPAEREAQGRLPRGFSDSWWFKSSNKKEVKDGALWGAGGGVATF